MRLAKQFNDTIQQQLNIFAAWLPVANTFQLGDYGIMDDGVFTKMGNIKELGIAFSTGKGNDASIDFTSASTKVINFAAGVEVDVIPEGALNAKVTFDFQNEKSMLIKSPAINVNTIENVNEIGQKLIENPKWQRKFKVVHQTYTAREVAIMSTIDAGTKITFSGDVKALQQLNVGNINVGYQSTRKLGLDLQGVEGVIGLGLFQIVKGGFLGWGEAEIKILADDEKGDELEIQYLSPGGDMDDL
jgi:hypothetical protein